MGRLTDVDRCRRRRRRRESPRVSTSAYANNESLSREGPPRLLLLLRRPCAPTHPELITSTCGYMRVELIVN